MNLKTFFFSTIRSYLFDYSDYVLLESATHAILSFFPSELNDNGLRRLMYSFVLFIISLAELKFAMHMLA